MNREFVVTDLMPPDWDRGPYSVIGELKRLLGSIVDHGSSIDTGSSANEAYLYAQIDGVEYCLTVVENRRMKQGEDE